MGGASKPTSPQARNHLVRAIVRRERSQEQRREEDQTQSGKDDGRAWVHSRRKLCAPARSCTLGTSGPPHGCPSRCKQATPTAAPAALVSQMAKGTRKRHAIERPAHTLLAAAAAAAASASSSSGRSSDIRELGFWLVRRAPRLTLVNAGSWWT